MKLLLDTHVYLWWVSDSRSLSKAARKKIVGADAVFVSAASIWEAIIKIGIGKLAADPAALVRGIAESGFEPLPVTPEHALALTRLRDHHKDPFDRILLAQAITEPLYFLTADRALSAYSDLVLTV
ncbi:type II toxin-antitoxin system VapC family toxin [bacterium]|nr:MAG: type II toxin-antitoxin system VapC family toxin [bacterium]